MYTTYICDKCNEIVESRFVHEDDYDCKIEIIPCKNCLEEEFNRGIDECIEQLKFIGSDENTIQNLIRD